MASFIAARIGTLFRLGFRISQDARCPVDRRDLIERERRAPYHGSLVDRSRFPATPLTTPARSLARLPFMPSSQLRRRRLPRRMAHASNSNSAWSATIRPMCPLADIRSPARRHRQHLPGDVAASSDAKKSTQAATSSPLPMRSISLCCTPSTISCGYFSYLRDDQTRHIRFGGDVPRTHLARAQPG